MLPESQSRSSAQSPARGPHRDGRADERRRILFVDRPIFAPREECPDQVECLFREIRTRAEAFKNLPRILLPVRVHCRACLAPLIEQVKKGGAKQHPERRLFLPGYLRRETGNLDAVGDSREVPSESALHLQGDTILEQVVPLSLEAQALLLPGIPPRICSGGTAEVHSRIEEHPCAGRTSSFGLVLEELDQIAARGAINLENIARLPVPGILTGTSHPSFLPSFLKEPLILTVPTPIRESREDPRPAS